jgi:hypothetical protein
VFSEAGKEFCKYYGDEVEASKATEKAKETVKSPT